MNFDLKAAVLWRANGVAMPNFPCSSLGIATLKVVGEKQELPPGTGTEEWNGEQNREHEDLVKTKTVLNLKIGWDGYFLELLVLG